MRRAIGALVALAALIGGGMLAEHVTAQPVTIPVGPNQTAADGSATRPSIRGTFNNIGAYFASTYFGITGHIVSAQSAGTPAVVSCGSGTLASGSTDSGGAITLTGATGCTLNFGVAYALAPSCVVTNNTLNRATQTVAITTTNMTLAGFTAADIVTYICLGRTGG